MGITQQIGASSLIKPGVIDSAAARPASPYEGQVIFQKDTDQLLVWNGTAWVIPNKSTQNPDGLELVTSVTCSTGGTASNGVVTVGSGVSSVVIGNAFSSTYDNYRIVYSGGNSSGAGWYQFQFDASHTNAYYGYIETINYQGTTLNQGTGDGGKLLVARVNNAAGSVAVMFDVCSPMLAQRKAIFGVSNIGPGSAMHGGEYGPGTTFSGFALSTSSGVTMTGGIIAVYGYRKSI